MLYLLVAVVAIWSLAVSASNIGSVPAHQLVSGFLDKRQTTASAGDPSQAEDQSWVTKWGAVGDSYAVRAPQYY